MPTSKQLQFDQTKKLRFDQKLVLNQWLLGLFEADSFDMLSGWLKDPRLEGFDENNISHYYHELRARLWDRKRLPADLLLAYDQNIVRHWQRITARRNAQGHVLLPKYFQYLALLCTEIYLDRFLGNPGQLLIELNQQVALHNQGLVTANQVEPYQPDELNKIAFWMATGSGKTLLMHINILQYQHYAARYNHRRDINRILLLTPNDGLSRQHLAEFALSDIDAELFMKEGRSLFAGRAVEIIDIHKLREEAGEKTVAVEAFEGNNLVLVDEGHRGTSGKETGEWMKRRAQLCEQGFSFEYSATFGQAIKASGNADLERVYTHCILYDYSYKYFYGDGYGKEYRILNLEDDSDDTIRTRYLTACLLAFYQQQRVYADKESEFRPYLVEKPLWIFVGGRVNAVRTENKRQVSDVVDILLFLAGYCSASQRPAVIRLIDRFLKGRAGLLDNNGRDIFENSFAYLLKTGLNAEQIYQDTLQMLFNAAAPAALHVCDLKGSDGEIALQLGPQEPFGLINVGDTSSLCKLCQEQPELIVEEREFSGSLFQALDQGRSSITMLIGSKKFTEGWSSWRVSTMGLMNIGKSEGSEIIQLFGHGVRLKGRDFSLKRSHRIEGVHAPADLECLETLNIFGIRANYMRQFKEYLEEEGLPANEDLVEYRLPVLNLLGDKRLRTIQLQAGKDFKRQGPRPLLVPPAGLLAAASVVLDWYPIIQVLTAKAFASTKEGNERETGVFRPEHIAFLDLDAIYLELQRHKNERAWYNLSLSRESIRALLLQPGWYTLYIPPNELEFHGFSAVHHWQAIAIALLKKYCDRFYKYQQAAWENDYLEYVDLTPDDGNWFEEYQITINRSQDAVIARLDEIQAAIKAGQLHDIEGQGLMAIMFRQHLYQPLLYVRENLVEIRPVVLNEGERDFIIDLKAFYESNSAFFYGLELYLLRNRSRGHGVGFFEAGNFYPDYILWLVQGNQQRIVFIDPKGIRNLQGVDDPKIKFYETIKHLEARLGNPQVSLESFIISNTAFNQISYWDFSKEELQSRHVLFQKDDKSTYIRSLLTAALTST